MSVSVARARALGFWTGAAAAVPIVMGYVPIGMAYGVLAKQVGLSLFPTMAMSLFVFAGSSQFIAVSMLAAGQPILAIVATTFIVNLRHVLFSTALAPSLGQLNMWQRIIFGLELTDEAFGLHSNAFAASRPSAAHILGLNMTAHFAWVLGSLLGFQASAQLGNVSAFGIDYALPAMFICLIVLQTRDRLMVVIGSFAGLLAVAITLLGLKDWSAIVATLIAATVGLGLERLLKREGLRRG